MSNNFNNICVLKGFANYYDRKIFHYDTLSGYKNASIASIEFTNINFNPNDGIETTLDMHDPKKLPAAHSILECNYLLVLTSDGLNTIVSRWWIMDCVREREGILKVTLRRDVVAEAMAANDGKGKWFRDDASFYVEKGMIPSREEYLPLLVNDEGLNLNKIKVDEILLKDEFKTAWIVGYFDGLNNNVHTINVALPGLVSRQYKTIAELEAITGIPQAQLESLFNGAELKFATENIHFKYGVYGVDSNGVTIKSIEQYIAADISEVFTPSTWWQAAWSHAVGTITGKDFVGFANYGYDYILDDDLSPEATIRAALTDVIDNQEAGAVYLSYEQLDALENVLRDFDVLKGGNYYHLELSFNGIENAPEVVVSKGENSWFDGLISYSITEYGGAEELNDWEIYVNYKVKKITADIQPAQYSQDTAVIQIPSSVNSLDDNPYSMFAIPIGSLYYLYDIGGNDRVEAHGLKQEWALRCASEIARQLGKTLYDLQILPYAPNIIRSNSYFFRNPVADPWIDMKSGYTANKDYTEIKDTSNVLLGYIFFEKKSSVSFEIRESIYSKRSSLKIESQTDSYRLCSPNYNGAFDFNLAKNGGSVTSFYVDCTYKPINPFIRVTPKFNYLYGGNYKDGRGLICGGDFSLAIIENNWINYEQYNKNYASIFARDIQNLDFRQNQERILEGFKATAGVIGGTAAGAVSGAKVGGPYGAIAGAAVGLGLGTAGAAIDLNLARERREETKDYAIDRFNLNLSTIKAQPQSLSKNSVLTIINKIYPFVERYTCSDTEVEALENKIKYDGMTVNKIIEGIYPLFAGWDLPKSDLRQYKFFKGQLIHANGINEDNHFIQNLYNEFAKGVYL